LSLFADFIKDGRTVGILRGGFAISRESSDLKEVQGRYCKYPREVKNSGGAGPLIRVIKGPSDLLVDSHIGVSGIETP
jgi:hypothetical protein